MYGAPSVSRLLPPSLITGVGALPMGVGGAVRLGSLAACVPWSVGGDGCLVTSAAAAVSAAAANSGDATTPGAFGAAGAATSPGAPDAAGAAIVPGVPGVPGAAAFLVVISSAFVVSGFDWVIRLWTTCSGSFLLT